MNEQEIKLWLEVAQHDADTAQLIITNKGHADIGIYHIHQAIEKLLKALYLSVNIQPPRVHFLDQLVSQLEFHFPKIVNSIDNIILIYKYLPKLRYPNSDQIKFDELLDCWDAFAQIKKTIDSIQPIK